MTDQSSVTASIQASVMLDIGNKMQTLTFVLKGSVLDMVTYSGNKITLSSTKGFTLSKTDYLIYVSSLNSFVNDIISNMPGIQSASSAMIPVSSFDIKNVNTGVTNIYYTQTSLGNSVYSTNYIPSSQTAVFAVRPSITISVQEFLFGIQLMNFHATQVTMN